MGLVKLFTPGKSVRDRGTNNLTPGPLFSWLAPARNYWGTKDQGSSLVKYLVSLPFLTCWFHQSPVTKKPVRLRLYFCLLDPWSC